VSEDRVSVLNEDEQCAARQLIRHVFMCFKRYVETRLTLKAEEVRRKSARLQPIPPAGTYLVN
jgi:HIV-1 Vpr-binding protein